MFIAYILICTVITEECLRFDDNRGPYKTHAECVARTYEMVTPAKEFWQKHGKPGRAKLMQFCAREDI